MKYPNLRCRALIVSSSLALAAGGVFAQTPPVSNAAGSGAQPANTTKSSSAANGAASSAKSSRDHASYLFGLGFGEQLHSVGITDQVDVNALARGVREGLKGQKATREDQQSIQEFLQSVILAVGTQNEGRAKAFLDHNGRESGVRTTASGLQYKVIAAGDDSAPPILPTDEVTVNYRGQLLDGTEFDSSYARNTPATFKVSGVIKGWQEALVLMKPGAKWHLFIPPELAYGMQPKPQIPAGSLLQFDVEVLSAKAAPSPPMPSTPQLPPGHRTIPAPNPTPNQ